MDCVVIIVIVIIVVVIVVVIEEVEDILKSRDMTFKWIGEDTLFSISPSYPAFHFDTGIGRSNAWTFANVLVGFHYKTKNTPIENKALFYGDNTPINCEILEDCLKISDELCCAIPWQVGDVLLVDNRTVQHSRRQYQGDRSILVSLAKDDDR